MDPSLAAPIATLTGAIATAIIMWASYNYPRGYHRGGAEKNEDREVAARREREDAEIESRRAQEDADTAKLRGGHDVERTHTREDEDLAVKRQRLDPAPEPDPIEEEEEPVEAESVPDPEPVTPPKPPVKRAPRNNTSTKKAPPRTVAHPAKPKDPDGAEH